MTDLVTLCCMHMPSFGEKSMDHRDNSVCLFVSLFVLAGKRMSNNVFEIKDGKNRNQKMSSCTE